MLPDKPWKPDEVLKLFLGIFISMFAGMIVLDWMNPNAGPDAEMRVPSIFVGALSFHVVGLLLINSFLRHHQISWTTAFGWDSGSISRTILLGLVVAIGLVPLAWSLSHWTGQLLYTFEVEPKPQEAIEALRQPLSIPRRLAIGFIAIVLAPFVEEMLFRGILYPAIKGLGYSRTALWTTSVLFAAIHANAMTFVALMVLALTLTLLYESTQNLLASMVAHSLFNGANYIWVLAEPLPSPT